MGARLERVTTAGAVLRVAGIAEDRIRELAARGDRPLTTARAMSLAAFYERLVEDGLSKQEAGTLLAGLAGTDVSVPRAHADAIAALIRRLTEAGMARNEAWRPAEGSVGKKTAAVIALAEEMGSMTRIRWAAGTPPATASSVVGSFASCSTEAAESARAPNERARPRWVQHSDHRVDKGGEDMVDSEKRNGAESAGRLEKERERLEREREALEREREKLEREREKVERAQEEMETRLERQEERLEQLEEELEAREEALDDAAEELEVEGIEGIREMLDVVSDRIPHLMRGMHESVYSPEQVQATAQAFASFYKTLVDSGMPDVLAAEMTRQHFDNLQSQMQMQMKPRKSKHGCSCGDIPGPDFDPLGPNFDPFRRSQRSKPAEPAEPAAPCEPCSD
ncbi:MAG: hypothetical protein NTX69_06385 [Candidatus Bipolaricaulota bacterium]|nr:hypothetical protein [Candidatus Bipolaricaulota bacterium]